MRGRRAPAGMCCIVSSEEAEAATAVGRKLCAVVLRSRDGTEPKQMLICTSNAIRPQMGVRNLGHDHSWDALSEVGGCPSHVQS